MSPRYRLFATKNIYIAGNLCKMVCNSDHLEKNSNYWNLTGENSVQAPKDGISAFTCV